MKPEEFVGLNNGDPNREFKIATIDPAYTSGLAKLTFDGENTLTTKGYQFITSYKPAAGDKVLVAVVADTGIILGKYGDTPTTSPPASCVKSIQRGNTYIPASYTADTVNIAAIDMNKSIALINISVPATAAGPAHVMAYPYFSSSTRIQFIRGTSSSVSPQISWQVIEYNNVKSIQRGSTNIGTSSFANISQVDLTKAVLYCHFTSSQTSTSNNTIPYIFVQYYINSSTRLYFTTTYTGITAYWQLIEFN